MSVAVIEEDTFESQMSTGLSTNMLSPMNLFVGREQLIADVVGQLGQGMAVISLVGMGGMGKTRLSEAIAERVQETLLGSV